MRSEAPRRLAICLPFAVQRLFSGNLARAWAALSMFVGDAMCWPRRARPVPVVSLNDTRRK